jgi:signal transduction histidine kinase
MSEMTGYIVSEVDRVNGLIASFLDFARPLHIRPLPADLQAVIDDVVRQQSELARSRNVAISVRMDDGPFWFLFDPDLLKSAISNLVQNAIEASAPGQGVEIRADSRDENVMIFVSDHGEGIQAQHLESIFNPFFTTKPHGTGLGLAIVSKIIDEHQGRINVFSEAGAGTTFEVTLPKGEQI